MTARCDGCGLTRRLHGPEPLRCASCRPLDTPAIERRCPRIPDQTYTGKGLPPPCNSAAVVAARIDDDTVRCECCSCGHVWRTCYHGEREKEIEVEQSARARAGSACQSAPPGTTRADVSTSDGGVE